jgi:hypothetical protein
MRSVGRMFVAAGLAALVLWGGGCGAKVAEYRSGRPEFVLQYPSDWQLQVEGLGAGQEMVLTDVSRNLLGRPDPRADDPRIVFYLQLVERAEHLLPGHYQVELDIDEGWRGRRYVVYRVPLTPVVEVFARKKDFEKADRVAQDLAQQLARQFDLPEAPGAERRGGARFGPFGE